MKTAEKSTKSYVKALRWMPRNFTSHFFTKKLRELGVSDAEIENDYYYNFLSSECIKLKRFQWEKKGKVKVELESINEEPIEKPKTRKYNWVKRKPIGEQELVIETASVMLTEEQMVKELKAKGYKVLKQVWNEL